MHKPDEYDGTIARWGEQKLPAFRLLGESYLAIEAGDKVTVIEVLVALRGTFNPAQQLGDCELTAFVQCTEMEPFIELQ